MHDGLASAPRWQAGVTAREREVAALPAEKMNREIAAALDRSEKTVATRTELAVGVTRVGPAEEARTHARLQ